MKIHSLSLQNFRVYSEIRLNITGDLIFFTGQNGLGKTSILEALSIASTLKSFRSVSDKDIISWNKSFYGINIGFQKSQGDHSLQVGYGAIGNEPAERRLFFDKNRIEKISKFVGKFKTVVFSPNDIEIVDSNPQERRRFFDLVLSSIYPEYLTSLQKYLKLLKMRSHLFKNERFDQNYLESIDKEISIYGSFIAKKRITFLKDFQPIFKHFIDQISGERDEWEISTHVNFEKVKDPESYFQNLRDNQVNDLRLRQTTFGIHRDRFVFKPPNQKKLELKQIASQGQKRTVVLALKMAQFVITRQMTSSTPVLLIDDVINELDIERRKKFIEFLHEIGQAWIATTDVESIKDYLEFHQSSVKIQVFQIKNENNKTLVEEV